MNQRHGFALAILVPLLLLGSAGIAQDDNQGLTDNTYNEQDIYMAATDLFGETTEGLARVIERIFSDLGEPNAYIAGGEGGGAFIVGLTYGSGDLYRRGYDPVRVYWQGPSIGFDVGGDLSKVFTLVYNLPDLDSMYQRFPAVEGSIFFIGGVGAHYQRDEGITLAPIRLGVGLRAGVNIGVMRFTRTRRYIPF